MTDFDKRHYDAHLDALISEAAQTNRRLDTSVALLTEITRRHETDIKDMKTVMYGAVGDNGLISRVNIMDRTEANRSWHIRTIWTTIWAAIIGSILVWLGLKSK